MPRRSRIKLAGIPQHLVQRGVNREPCFFADEDYYCYLHWLEEAAADWHCQIHAYVLMTNHVHLLVTPETEEGPAKLMSIWNAGLSQIVDDPNIDKMYAALLAELDVDKRKAIFSDFQKYMYDNAVTMALGNYGMFQVVSAKVKNFAPYRIPRMWGVWLDA